MLRSIAAMLLLTAPAAAQDYTPFQTPSGNIHCAIYGGGDAGLRCDMIELTPSFTKAPVDCELDWGSSFAIDPRSKTGFLACVGDTVINAGNATLGYGSTLSAAGFSCTSEKTGLTCSNAVGHGFALSKARQRFF